MKANEQLCEKLIKTNRLTATQYNDVQNLFHLCKQFEDLEGLLFLEPELNLFPEFPCFYLLYENSILISFLSIFIPNEKECEIYAYTHPDYRKRGYFTNLFECALSQIEKFEIESIYFVNEPGSNSGKSALTKINTQLASSEYIMKWDPEFIPSPKNILTLEVNDSCEYFKARLNQEVIGECCVDHSDSCSTIYDFEILSSKRGRGYGKEMLLLILDHLAQMNYKNIVLHVSSTNKAAYRLYSTNGFAVLKQVDYWMF